MSIYKCNKYPEKDFVMIFEFFYYTFIAMVIILAWMVYDDVRMEKRNNG